MPEFRIDWSQISWKCTRDWLILIINTSKRLADSITIQISITEAAMKTTVQLSQFKSRLAEINLELNETKEYLTRQKINKLQKDIKRFSREKIYPYTKDDYHCEGTSETSEDSDVPQRKTHAPHHSSSSDDWSSDEGQRTNRNRRSGEENGIAQEKVDVELQKQNNSLCVKKRKKGKGG
ncbi:hypothetical protein NDU88_000951 [Pleurodeles waltl]|uniref:Uncharacterized protein n=1 Tax=Pleurodeles waltl TaxID=8319 RepID=A0AAV7R6E7_PLEWA|nr:hypothetical protein NDU88_000951 [Pleurodeles waltl]